MLQSHGYSVSNDAIVSKDRVTTDDDSAEMLDSEPPAERNLTGKLDAGEYLGYDFQNLIEERKWHPQPAPANGVTPASKAVYTHHPEALPKRCSAVGTPILAQIIKQDQPPLSIGHLRKYFT